MNTLSTNKAKSRVQNIQKLSQPDLHIKILNLVANRMDPTNASLVLEKQACDSCVNRVPSPSICSTKKNSLASTRAQEAHKMINRTMYEGRDSLKERKGKKDNNQGSITQPSLKEIILKGKKRLQIASKVVSYSIDHSKIGDFTIDLRSQIPTQFVNVKMINKLRLENAEKQKRIAQLQAQVFQLHERIIEYGTNMKNHMKAELQKTQSEVFKIIKISSQGHISKEDISLLDQEMEKQSSGSGNMLLMKQPSNKQEEHLLRMLLTQSIQLEKCRDFMASEKQKGCERPKFYSRQY